MNFLPSTTHHDEANRDINVALLPIGSFEQHGAHLPLTTDTLVASSVAAKLAESYEGLRLLAPLTYSCSHEHTDFAGTVSISAKTLISCISDIRQSLEHQGVDKVVLVNGHGGNYVLSNIAQEANVTQPLVSVFPSSSDWAVARSAAEMKTIGRQDMHGGELETSILLHVAPHLVRDGWESADHTADERPALLMLGMKEYTASGIIGRPSLASAQKGQLALSSITKSFQTQLDALGS